MWRYRQPGFALQLLHELQDQQRGGLQCDTLLQTEGVSVPAHSCVLSALSPVFSRALTNPPSVPVGHSRLVRLQAVRARALIKLVGFLYSGEMEGEGLGELQDVIDAAHRLGFCHLMDGLKKQMNGQQDKAVRWREIGLQTEDNEKEKKDANVQIMLERESFMCSGIQTDCPEAYFVNFCSVPEFEQSVAPPGELTFAHNDKSTTGLELVKDITASSNFSEASVPVHSRCYQQINKRRKVPKKINKNQLSKICRRRNPNVEETQSELFKSRVLESVKGAGGKDFRELVEKLGFQSSRAFEEQGDTQISLKIKLKRRRGARWEIVGVQEESRSDGPASPGEAHSHSQDGVTLTQPQRNHPEVLQNPSPTFPRQGLGTVTLTPPSELTLSSPATPAKPASEQSGSHSHDTGPPPSPLQMPPLSPGVLQTEESDEHIASLLEDMVMMGLNILPSDGNNNVHHLSEKHSSPKPHLDLKKCGDAAPGPPLCMNDHNLGSEGPDVGKIPPPSGSFAPGEAGSECPGTENQSKSGAVELKSISSLANHSKSSAITSPHVTSLKDADPSFMLPCSAPERVIAFSPEGLKPPHQNVGELRNVLDDLFWSADDVQSVEQTKSKTSEGHYGNLQTSKQCPEAWRDPKVLPHNSPRTARQAMFRQTTDFICATSCEDRADLNETRLPSCLSSLVLEDGQTDSFTQNCVDISSPHCALKPAWKSMRSSPVPQTAPGETDQQNLDLFIQQKAQISLSSQSSEPGRSSCNSRSNKDYIQQTSEGRSEQAVTEGQTLENQMFGEIKDVELDRQTGELGLKAVPTKRSSLGSMVNEPKRKKLRMPDCVSTQFWSQMVKTAPCRANSEVVEDINHTEHSDHPSSKKMYFLRASKSVRSVSTKQKFMKKLKTKNKSTEDLDKKQPANRKRGRPRKRRSPAGLKQQLDKEMKSNSSFAGFQASACSEKDNLHLTQQRKTNSELEKNEECDLMKDKKVVCLAAEHGCGRPSKEKDALGQSKSELNDCDEPPAGVSTYTGDQYLQKIKTKVKDRCEKYEMQGPAMGNASEYEEVFAEETKQPRIQKSQEKRTSIVDLVFHQTVFSVGSAVGRRVPSISQQLGWSFWDADISKTQTTERKRNIGPPQSLKFNKLKSRDLLRGGKFLKDGSEREEKDNAGKSERVMDQSKDSNMHSESMSLNNGNGCLVDEKSETDTRRNQTDKISDAVIACVQPDLSNPRAKLTSHLHTVPSARNLGQNCEMENDPECRSTKIFADVDRTEDFFLQESTNTQIVHPEGWNQEKVDGNVEMEADRGLEINRTNELNVAEGEMVEKSPSVAAVHGEERSTSDCIADKSEVEESLSRVQTPEGESAACKEGLMGRQILRTEDKIMPSDEALTHTDPPAVAAKEALSVRLGEKPEETNPSTSSNIMGSPPASSAGVNVQTEVQECGEEEEVVDVDVWSSPGTSPHFLTVRESITVLPEEDKEEEEVDVTGDETD